MLRMLLHWIVNAIVLLVVSHIVSGFVVSNLISALIAVLIIGLFNATIGLFLKIVTLPLRRASRRPSGARSRWP
jgi:putative membrane protein